MVHPCELPDSGKETHPYAAYSFDKRYEAHKRSGRIENGQEL